MHAFKCIVLISLLSLLNSKSVNAQQTGKVNLDQLGISFTIPQDWIGQATEEMYVLGSNSVPGLVLLMPQNYASVDIMRSELQMGYADAMGTNLQLEGSIEDINHQTIGATYAGTLEGQAAKAFVIGALNPHGHEVLIMSITTAEMYSETQENVAKAVQQSLQFSKPKTAPAAEKWRNDLAGTRLTYMNSYYSSSYSSGGISGGYSTKLRFDLCPEGYFWHNGSDVTTAGGSYSSMYNAGSSKGSGTWKIVANANDAAVLQFNFNNGDVWEYNLAWEDGKLFLNGNRYFRTWEGEYAPNCP